MDCANSGARQHGVGGLRNHRHVDDDAITFSDAQLFQNIREFADAMVQLVVRDVLRFVLGAIWLPNDRCLIATFCKMPVDTVGRDIQAAIFEPFDADVSRRVTDILNLGVWLDPINPLTMLAPKPFWIVDRLGVHLIVFRLIRMSTRRHRI